MPTTFPEFKWRPDLGATPTVTPMVTQVKFGDGYELRVAESLNRTKTSWTLTFTRTLQECSEIHEFLLARAGLEAFQWTDTLGRTATYVCREWQGPVQQYRGVYVVSATFEEVFES